MGPSGCTTWCHGTRLGAKDRDPRWVESTGWPLVLPRNWGIAVQLASGTTGFMTSGTRAQSMCALASQYTGYIVPLPGLTAVQQRRSCPGAQEWWISVFLRTSQGSWTPLSKTKKAISQSGDVDVGNIATGTAWNSSGLWDRFSLWTGRDFCTLDI